MGAHNQIASLSQTIQNKPSPKQIDTFEDIKQAQRNLSDKQVNSTESVLELMKELEELASNLPKFEHV